MAVIPGTFDTTSLNQSIALILSADLKTPTTAEQLTPAKRINEQEGYAVLVHQALKTLNPKIAARLEQELKQATALYKKNHGNTNLFKIADRLMRQYLREKVITQEQYRTVRDHAFGRTQLDSNRTLLGDERSPEAKSGDTPVRALSTFYRRIESNPTATPDEIAQFRASEAEISKEKWREKKKAGAPEIKTAEAVTIENTESSIGGIPPGFLWKPQSETDGKLVILLPSSVDTRSVKSVAIIDPASGKTIETGRFSGIGNGDRLHFRFSRSGANFPDHSVVEINFINGSRSRVAISDSASRSE